MTDRAIAEGQRVAVRWERHGWLPGTFERYSSPSIGERFKRCRVKMDNGWACHGDGYHPDCVKVAVPEGSNHGRTRDAVAPHHGPAQVDGATGSAAGASSHPDLFEEPA